MSFSARDAYNKSVCMSYKLDLADPLKVLESPVEPDYMYDKELGSYYSDGFMVSQHYYMPLLKETVTLFTGWERLGRKDVTYRTCCGQVYRNSISTPLIDRSIVAPCGSSMPFKSGNEVYYMAVDKWEAGESFYHIARYYKTAQGQVVHDSIINRLENEGGLARPVRFDLNLEGLAFHIMFSARGASTFRDKGPEAYKLWIASQTDEGWTRQEKPLEIIGEDGIMNAYGYPIKVQDKWFVFYNSNFRSQIHVAELEP